MTFPLHELRGLIAQEKRASFGMCVAIEQGMATVATASGPVKAIAGPGVRVGERVRIEDGTAYPAPSAVPRYAV